MTLQDGIEQVQRVKRQCEQSLLALSNVIGVGVGLKEIGGQVTDQIAIIANVTQKLPPDQLDPPDMVPPQLSGVPTDVQEMGLIKPARPAATREDSLFPKMGHLPSLPVILKETDHDD